MSANTITKGITSTVVTGFVLNTETNVPELKAITFDGALTKERAEGKARKECGSMLVTSVEQVRTYYQLDREIAMANATNERTAKDDIQLGETSTTVYFLKLKEIGKPDVEPWSITFDSPMTQSRAFGAARRNVEGDILPYAAVQERNAKFISRAKFFELASVVEKPADVEEAEEDIEA